MPQLLGHFLATFLVFATLFTLAWALDFCCAWLNNIRPLSQKTFKLLSGLERGILYGDAALCAYSWLTGSWRFLKEMMR